MSVRRLVHYVRRGSLAEPRYEKAGVWTQGPGPGLDITMDYLPGYEDEAEWAEWIVNRLVEARVNELPEDFLERWAEAGLGYRGVFGPVRDSGFPGLRRRELPVT